MKVLMAAYACEPGKGSEPGVGWHFAVAAAQRHDVTVITRANNQPRIDYALGDVRVEGSLTFEYLDLPHALRFKRGNRGIRTYYVRWQRALTDTARRLHRRHTFDVLHHVTLAADWLPAGLAQLSREVPFVWGPVGGATGTPWSLARWLTPTGLMKEVARTAVTGVARATLGRSNARRAAVTLALNTDVARALQRYGVRSHVEQHAVVTPPGVEPTARPSDEIRPPTAVFAGRLEGWKGLLLAIEAIGRTPDWRLELYGEGPDRKAAERRAEGLGIDDRVVFHGAVPLDHVHAALERADALLFPSMHDSSPFVVAEAIAMGCPIVCLDRGGPADMVDARSGVVVSAGSRDLPAALARALGEARAEPYDGRWGPERLPERLSRYYQLAVNGE